VTLKPCIKTADAGAKRSPACADDLRVIYAALFLLSTYLIFRP
jgi:hypothetical protein